MLLRRLISYDNGVANIQRMLRIAAITVHFIFLYCVVIVATPFALIVLAIAFLIRWMTSRHEKEAASTVSMAWLIAVGASAWVINLLCVPIGLLWCRIRGKPMPHPVD